VGALFVAVAMGVDTTLLVKAARVGAAVWRGRFKDASGAVGRVLSRGLGRPLQCPIDLSIGTLN